MKILLFSVNSLFRTYGAFVKIGKIPIKVLLTTPPPTTNFPNNYCVFDQIQQAISNFLYKCVGVLREKIPFTNPHLHQRFLQSALDISHLQCYLDCKAGFA